MDKKLMTSKKKKVIPPPRQALKILDVVEKEWKSVITVYICPFDCGFQNENRDETELHSIQHYRPEDREKVLEYFVREKE